MDRELDIKMDVSDLELNLFAHLVELAPGFIGVATSKLFHGDNSQAFECIS